MSYQKITVTILDLLKMDFDFRLTSYPVINEEWRERFNDLFYDYYLMDQIGSETPELFRQRLLTKLELIMPNYNKMLQAQLLNINPNLSFSRTRTEVVAGVKGSGEEQEVNVNISETDKLITETSDKVERETKQNDTRNTGTDIHNESFDVDSDAPPVPLEEVDIKAGKYAKGVQTSKGDDSQTVEDILDSTVNDGSVSTGNTTNDNTKSAINKTESNIDKVETDNTTTIVTENGYEVPLSELIIKYGESLVNVEQSILDELQSLFLGIMRIY